MKTKHTPLPWSVNTLNCDQGKISIVDKEEFIISELYFCYNREANADFIVKACNNHYKLVEAVQELLSLFDGTDDYEVGVGECHPKIIKGRNILKGLEETL